MDPGFSSHLTARGIIIGMMNWINANTGAISAILTFVLTIATTIYVFLTRQLLRESVTVREASSRPSVVIRLSIHETQIHLLNLAIENFGNGPVLSLEFTVKQYCQERRGVKDLAKIGFFRKGLHYLAPHERIDMFVANAIGNLDVLKQQPWTIGVRYRDAADRIYSESFTIDFSEFEGISRVGDSPFEKMSESLEKIRSDFGSLISGQRRLTVKIYSLEDEYRQERISELFYKLHELGPEAFNAVEALVNEQSDRVAASGTPDVSESTEV